MTMMSHFFSNLKDINFDFLRALWKMTTLENVGNKKCLIEL